MAETKFGCEHYARKCAFISPCCEKKYICRICHNDKENHELDRRAVKIVECLMCDRRQEATNKCISCEVEFGKYYCSICHLYDYNEKGQFHCTPCGICRIGGKDKFFHCVKCDMCLGITLKDDHKCIERVTRSNCPVCLEDMHTSRQGLISAPCGHFIHTDCSREMLKNGQYACPICGASMIDMKSFWADVDNEVENVQMPEEYRNIMKHILCRDCHQKSRVKFHVAGLKCQNEECGSYNTCDIADEDDAPPETASSAGDH